MRVYFEYTEVDDEDSFMTNLSFAEVSSFIADHNEYFETEYQTIQEFNDGEELREFTCIIVTDDVTQSNN